MTALTVLDGILFPAACSTHSRGSSSGIDVVNCVFVVERMTPLAMRLTGEMVRSMLNAIHLVLGISSLRQVLRGIASRIAVQMSNLLSRDSRADECFIHQVMDETDVLLLVPARANCFVPFVVGELFHDSAGFDERSSTVRNGARKCADSALVGYLVVRKTWYRTPFFHDSILARNSYGCL